jgi:serine/threonine-protein kinase
VDGGAPIDVAEATWGSGAWGPDDSIVHTPSYASGLWQVPAGGGSARKLTEPVTKDGELGHWWPQFLPDGHSVLLTNYRSRSDESRIEVLSLATGQRRTVIEQAVFGRYVPTGHLLFVRANTVFAIPFDVERLVTEGQPTPVLDGVATHNDNAMAHFAVSPAGTLIYLGASELNAPSQLTWVTRAGATAPVGFEPRRYGGLSLSPDEGSLAASINTDGQTDVWIGDISRGTLRRVTDAPGSQFSPVWVGADGRRLAYASEEPAYHIYLTTIGSTGTHERVVDGTYDTIPTSASRDGHSIIFDRNEPETRGDIVQLPLEGARKPRALVTGRFQETDGQLSPDGQWLAYMSAESGLLNVYVQDLRTGGDRIQISNGGGNTPRWSADSRELFFRSGEQLMVVSVDARPRLTASRPVRLFEMQFQTDYAVTRDGRFLVGLRDPRARPAQVRVALNWFDDLRARVPVP